MLQQQPESGGKEVEKRNLRWKVGGGRGVQKGRRVMIGWKRTEEERRRGGTERIEAGREK